MADKLLEELKALSEKRKAEGIEPIDWKAFMERVEADEKSETASDRRHQAASDYAWQTGKGRD